jgi:hypothetical protein
MTGMIIIWENDDDVLGLQYRIHIGVINHPPVINLWELLDIPNKGMPKFMIHFLVMDRTLDNESLIPGAAIWI